jgi:integrase
MVRSAGAIRAQNHTADCSVRGFGMEASKTEKRPFHENTHSFCRLASMQLLRGPVRPVASQRVPVGCVEPEPLILAMPGRKPIKPEDESRVLAALATFSLRDQGAFVLGINSGFRATELLSLNVGDVWENGRMRTSVTVARRRLKGGRGRRRKNITSRTVPLNDAAIAVLQKYLFSRFGSGPVPPKEPLFPSRFHGMRLTRWRLNHLVKEVMARAGVGNAEQFGTHSLRKTFAQKIFTATGHDINLTRLWECSHNLVYVKPWIMGR